MEVARVASHSGSHGKHCRAGRGHTRRAQSTHTGKLPETPTNTQRLQGWPQPSLMEWGGWLAGCGRAFTEEPWRSQPSGRVFFSSLAGSPRPLPSLPPLQINKYLGGQQSRRGAGPPRLRVDELPGASKLAAVVPPSAGYGARSPLFRKGNVALPKI